MTIKVRDQDDVILIRGTLAGADPGVIAAAGDYAALDVLSDDADAGEGHAWVFANAARGDNSGGSGYIEKVVITNSVDGLAMKYRLHLFHTAPTTSELDDNAAGAITVADRASYIGYVENTTDAADLGTMSAAQIIPSPPFPYKCAAGATSLYGILQTVDAETGETAGMTVSIELHCRRR